ncbi:unnamed protein product [Protopolystoma xenopodis]|uniref:Uncharacterized protein n=1 Tax=Protopolystoma xenopodis TaxID=117903 RepID=A0A3S5AR86_9PLAT|nr:unnamed protein product [Protopolystoma xenopodis]
MAVMGVCKCATTRRTVLPATHAWPGQETNFRTASAWYAPFSEPDLPVDAGLARTSRVLEHVRRLDERQTAANQSPARSSTKAGLGLEPRVPNGSGRGTKERSRESRRCGARSAAACRPASSPPAPGCISSSSSSPSSVRTQSPFQSPSQSRSQSRTRTRTRTRSRSRLASLSSDNLAGPPEPTPLCHGMPSIEERLAALGDSFVPKTKQK